jgi:hypothetical protein
MKAHMLQRKCACGGSSAPCQCPHKQRVQQTAPDVRTSEAAAPSSQHEPESGGSAADPAARMNFSTIRIHAKGERTP